MGTSHFKSDVAAKAGTETITGFATISGTTVSGTTMSGTTISGTTVTASGRVTGGNVAATSYIKIGSGHQYILFGGATLATSVVLAATALTATARGSLYISSAGKLFLFTANTTATTNH